MTLALNAPPQALLCNPHRRTVLLGQRLHLMLVVQRQASMRPHWRRSWAASPLRLIVGVRSHQPGGFHSARRLVRPRKLLCEHAPAEVSPCGLCGRR
jgi:hypothetical protein